MLQPLLIWSLGGIMTAVALYIARRRLQMHRDSLAYEQSILQGLHIPASLHPVIDPDICIGSLSCLSACPEGDILGVVDGKAALITASNCIGHGACALECPVSAIKLVFGTKERGVDLPEIDEHFESARTGLHIIGELGGMGLIKNAFTQGLQLANHLKKVLPANRSQTLDLAIIGAGPAGIAAALGCKQNGISFRILEQETMGGTVAHYPRQKIVMVDTIDIPFFGKFGRQQISKEDLMQMFRKMLQTSQVRVDENTRVEKISGQDGNFTIHTNRGNLTAKKIALAIGQRGTPRKLGVPGEDAAKVTYRLIEARQYENRRVLIVGGGDAAIESVAMLAAETKARITISYRQDAFSRCRPANREAIDRLIKTGRIKALMSSEVKSIHDDHVMIDAQGSSVKLPNDYVIINAGGILPLEFLKECGVEVKRYFGEERRKTSATATVKHRRANEEQLEEQKRRNFTRILTVVGVAIILVLTFVGWQYYWLPLPLRLRSPMHAFLKPGGPWGHGVGIVATLFLISNFTYAVRKRWRRLKGTKSIRSWLTFHMFVGFMSPLVILYHAAFQSKNVFATATYIGLLIVVGTGIIGRYIYGLVPVAGGKTMEYNELLASWEQTLAGLRPLLGQAISNQTRHFVQWVAAPGKKGASVISVLVAMPFNWLRLRFGLFALRNSLHGTGQYKECAQQLKRILRMKEQMRVYDSVKLLMRGWRVFHVVLSTVLVVLITIHIYISIYLGYRWIIK